MSESTKEQSLLNEYGKVEDQKLAEKMADAEKEVRNTFGKEEENKSEVDKWANEEGEGVFHEETGIEYSEAVKEAQEEASWEINGEISKVGEEIKSTDEIVAKKDGAAEEDIVEVKQADANLEGIVENKAEAAKGKIEGVVNKKFTRKDAKDLTKAALGADVFERDDLNAENEKKQNSARISTESRKILEELKNNKPKLETEIKNLEIRALQERANEELRSTGYALTVLKKGKSAELDALI